VTPTVVKQRLKLGAISPKLMRAYRNGNLDQLSAFAITDGHERQERVAKSVEEALVWLKQNDVGM
jgi:ParB family chromosome partitioning protein